MLGTESCRHIGGGGGASGKGSTGEHAKSCRASVSGGGRAEGGTAAPKLGSVMGRGGASPGRAEMGGRV